MMPPITSSAVNDGRRSGIGLASLLDAIRRECCYQRLTPWRVQQCVATLQRLVNNAARKHNAALTSSARRKSVLYRDLRNGSRAIVAISHRVPPDAEKGAIDL